MSKFWDYSRKDLEKTEKGRIKILEREINLGFYPPEKKKLPLDLIKKYWKKLKIDPDRRRFLEFIIWGKSF